MKINILDCTLRDGGYINDWKFRNSEISKIIDSLEKSGIDIIECGYLNDKNGQVKNSTLYDSLDTADKILSNSNSLIQKVIMINLGDYDIDKLKSKNETVIDGIRLAFHKKDLDLALKEANKIIQLGYKLFFQPMVTKNYTEIDFLSLVEKVNQLNPHAFYIVDSFGSMTLNEFQNYMMFADSKLNEKIILGYHSHNNMQLAFSNAINMCNTDFSRDIIIDSSIYGIGRGAGNLNTELITDYLNNTFNEKYETLPLLEIIDEFLNSLMKKKPWGFSPAQYLSASFDCHPNYATYLINKNTNHIVGVRKVLEKLSDENKSSFDKELIEKLYIDSLLEIKTTITGTLNIPINKKVLLVASGKSVEKYKDIINNKVNDENYITIALNHKETFECDYYFFSNQKRFDEFKFVLPMNKIIITSNVLSDIELETVVDFKSLPFVGKRFVTNVAIVIVNYLITQGIAEVEIAGLDGYQVGMDNYSYKETSVISDDKELIEQNNIIKESIKSLAKDIDITFVTPSIFK